MLLVSLTCLGNLAKNIIVPHQNIDIKRKLNYNFIFNQFINTIIFFLPDIILKFKIKADIRMVLIRNKVSTLEIAILEE